MTILPAGVGALRVDRLVAGEHTVAIASLIGYDDSLDVEPEAVNRLLGYEESFWPQGLWRMSDDRHTERVVRQFDI